MKFYVIYDFDVHPETPVGYYRPASKKMELTECWASNSEPMGDFEEPGKHRKYAGILTKDEFKKFIRDTYLYMSDVETMGSISEYGWNPAISFEYEYSGHIDEPMSIGAYVTPIPEVCNRQGPFSDRDFERVRKAMRRNYGY